LCEMTGWDLLKTMLKGLFRVDLRCTSPTEGLTTKELVEELRKLREEVKALREELRRYRQDRLPFR